MLRIFINSISLLFLEREMEKRKHESRTELEARREERRRRGRKRSVSPEDSSNKKSKTNHSPTYGDSVVTVSDASDVEMKSDSAHSEPEDGEFCYIHIRACVSECKFKIIVTSF